MSYSQFTIRHKPRPALQTLPVMKTGFSLCTCSLQGKTCNENSFFPVKNTYTGKTLFSLQGWVCSVCSGYVVFVSEIERNWAWKYHRGATPICHKSIFCWNSTRARKVTSVSKKLSLKTVIYHYYALWQFFWNRLYLRTMRIVEFLSIE